MQSYEAVTSMGKYLSEDIYSRVESNEEECLLNEGSSNAFMFEAITGQGEILVNEEEDQSEELVYKTIVDTVEHFDLKIEDLCMNAGMVLDDDILQQCHKEIALLEYLLENSEYEREIAEEGRVHHNEQKYIMETDGVKEGLVDSLENSSENSFGKENQHTDVLIEEEIARQHTEMLAKEEKALRHYDFCFNKCFVNAGVVAGARKHLTQLSSQMKKEENYVETSNPWNEKVMLLERMLNSQNSVQEESQFQNWEW